MEGQHAVFAYFFRRGLHQPAGTSVRPRHNCLRLWGDYSSLGLSALELLALEIFQKLPVLLPEWFRYLPVGCPIGPSGAHSSFMTAVSWQPPGERVGEVTGECCPGSLDQHSPFCSLTFIPVCVHSQAGWPVVTSPDPAIPAPPGIEWT